MIFARRNLIIIVSVALIVSTLLYVEHPAVRSAKTLAGMVGLTDSKRTIVGVTDIRSVDHVRGDPDADIILVEYSDFGCAMCALMQESFDRLVREEDMMVVSRHLYETAGGDSFEWAVAAECVAKHAGEEAYHTFAQYLYDNQYEQGIGQQALEVKAVELGADVKEFQRCIAGDAMVRERILRDSQEGWRLGARGTPYIIVIYDDTPVGISYANRYEDFLKRVRRLVRQAQREGV